MPRGLSLFKAVDEVDRVRCRSGREGVLREEAYVDSSGQVVRYNLAFIHFGLCQSDNGRVLGYDNAHGFHERHWMGRAESVQFSTYERTLEVSERGRSTKGAGMRTVIGIESFEAMRERKLERARKLDRGERVVSERRIMFESPASMLACLTPQRVRLCETAREKPRSITELSAALGRDRKAVHRDVKFLHTMGLLSLRKSVNPGHGQVHVVQATARRFRLSAEL